MADKNYTTDAINLHSYDLNDADKIIIMYSRDRGLIRSVAKGAKRPKSRLGARMDLLVANTLLFSKGRNLDTICQAQMINSFGEIRKDILKLAFSSYISEVTINLGLENDPNSADTYKLLYSALEKTAKSNKKEEIIIAAIKFQIKMMLIFGIIPELDNCLCCGEKITAEDMYFSKEYGGVFCKNCRGKYGGKWGGKHGENCGKWISDMHEIDSRNNWSKYDNILHSAEKKSDVIKLNYKLRDFLKAMLQYDFDDFSEYDEKATDKVCLACFNLLKDYIILHTGKRFKSVKVIAEIL